MPSIQEIAAGGLMHAAEMLVKDSRYIPEDKFDFCPMGCAKTAAAILREIAAGNDMLAAAIKRRESNAEFQAKVEKASGIAELGALVMESAKIASDAIASIPDEDMDKEAKMPWGASFPMYAAIFLPTSHMTYHDGQINYIQTLLGDSTFHWLE